MTYDTVRSLEMDRSVEMEKCLNYEFMLFVVHKCSVSNFTNSPDALSHMQSIDLYNK